MTSCSLRRLQELAAQPDQRVQVPNRCAASDEGVGTREQLVRVQFNTAVRGAARSDDCRSLPRSLTNVGKYQTAARQATKESERASSSSLCQHTFNERTIAVLERWPPSARSGRYEVKLSVALDQSEGST